MYFRNGKLLSYMINGNTAIVTGASENNQTMLSLVGEQVKPGGPQAYNTLRETQPQIFFFTLGYIIIGYNQLPFKKTSSSKCTNSFVKPSMMLSSINSFTMCFSCTYLCTHSCSASCYIFAQFI